VNDGDDPDLLGHPVPPEPWLYTRRFLEAAEVALVMHAKQGRKGTTIPYASHLLGACSIALDYGAVEDEAIAALLHDAIEDVDYAPGAREAVAAFGPEVLRIVDACTQTPAGPGGSWKARRQAYLAHLADADRSILLVSASDKLHNSRSIVADLRRVGDILWERFSVTKEDTLWYYRALVTAFRDNPATPVDLVDELDRVVTDMECLAGNGKPDAR
jgi:(p)ppGpp synthase/HD superfamily hydrolase